MSQLKRYNGVSWENVGGNIAPKTTQTNSDKDTYCCNYINEIVESGSNANGNYIKYIDGTMICWNYENGTGTLGDYWGTFKKIENINITFPIEFLNTPIVNVTPAWSQNNNIFSTGVDYLSNTDFNALVLKPSGSSSTNYSFNWIAIGRWKA